MKRTAKKIGLLAVAMTVGLAATSCAADTSGSTGNEGASGKTVCYITAAAAHPYVTPANEAIEKATTEAGVTLVEVSQEFDVQTGTDQLSTCVGRGVDGIILWPLDPDAYTSGLLKAQQAGIPVVAMNSPLGEDASKLVESFTGPDPYETGVLAAQLLNEELDGVGNIVVISGQAGNGTSVNTEAGFYAELEKLGSKIEVLQTVYANFDQQDALVASRDLITRFGDTIDGAFTIDDGMAHGFVDAWTESGSTKVPAVTGVNGQQDAFELIRSGMMTGTVLQSPVTDGEVAIATMIVLLEGKTVDSRIPIPLPVITNENIDEHQPAF
ncbi:sugar ABC transporter substrate-binding protein [Salinibacterium sp. TMP30]|uniref:sugar ABC transporter substrate-binding protein n=1 Tax=Salinibacterium sp. TMP30 TaxID=3138237 RepID=UPI003139E77F